MESILRAAENRSVIGNDTKRPAVLEVNQMWANQLMDAKHFTKRDFGHDVSIGSTLGYKWHFLGIDMGWVPDVMRLVLPYTPPMWSEVNSDWRNDFYAPDDTLPGTAGEHTLFTHNLAEESYSANVDATWDGFVDLEDKRYSFEELVEAGKATKNGGSYSVPMVPGLRLMVDISGVIFYSHMVPPGARILNRNSEDLDYPFLAISSVIGFIGMMFGIIMFFSPKPAENEMVEIPDRFVELLLDKPEPEKKEKKKPNANPDAGEGAKAKREEGKVGKKDAKMDKAKGNKVEVKKQEMDRQVAENAGILGALRDAGDLDGMFGSSGLDANLTGGIGGLIGAKGTQIGSGGLGARGSGLGGGGSAEGLGGLGTKGIGSGKSGYGSGGGNFGAKGEGGIGQVGGDPIILGALDRSLIDEVIKRHMNQIRYCYQRELTKNPALGGKVVIKFVIAKDGTVSSASVKNSTMGNSAVESCITGRFMRMQFPEPKGGGIVIVSYPFLFSPG
ncbi:MAG: AgmX/PglI C-terminal domain-containing protein [Rhodobacterales bacterium]|nr:AgmX/PglI C-terminal domain-containing protein [Rhodobacterales bacterium]